MNAISIINNLAATTKRSEKEQILMDAFMRGHREFFIASQMAYDILVTFGVKKVAEIDDTEDDAPGEFDFAAFLDLAGKLRRRELTGHAARDAIHAAAERCHIPTWNTFYRRVLLKDLRCGVDTSTINKVLKKLSDAEPEAEALVIPVFDVQLAQDGAKPEHQKKVSGVKMLDIKLDGVRLLTILDKEEGTVTQYTRNGKVNENFTELREGLQRFMDTLPGSIVIDGEVVSSNFQDLMKQVNRRDGVDTSKARLAVFDILPLKDFRAGICTIPQAMRQKILADLEESGDLKTHTNGLVYVIPKVTVDLNTAEGQKTFAEFNKAAIAAGYEGIMVKDPAAPYELKRSFAWLKIKPFIEVSLTIVGYEEGTGKYAGMLGAFIMEGEDDEKQIETNVGSGFSDDERIRFWADRQNMLGMIGEVRADALTLESGGTVYSLRFPRWKGVRGTVPGEKL